MRRAAVAIHLSGNDVMLLHVNLRTAALCTVCLFNVARAINLPILRHERNKKAKMRVGVEERHLETNTLKYERDRG